MIIGCTTAVLASRTAAALAFARLSALFLLFFFYLRPFASLAGGDTPGTGGLILLSLLVLLFLSLLFYFLDYNILYLFLSSSFISYLYKILDLWIFPSIILTKHIDSNIVSLIQL